MTKPEKTKNTRPSAAPQRHYMLESLRLGMVEEPYTDKVREYMNLRQLKRLEADVAERGVSVMDAKRDAGGEPQRLSLVQVSRQCWPSIPPWDLDMNPPRGGDDEL